MDPGLGLGSPLEKIHLFYIYDGPGTITYSINKDENK